MSKEDFVTRVLALIYSCNDQEKAMRILAKCAQSFVSENGGKAA